VADILIVGVSASGGGRLPGIVARVGGGACATLALVVLTGWHLDVPALVQVRSGFAPMQYNTALTILGAGLGLYAAATGRARVGAVLGALVAAVAASTLVQDLLQIDFGIDRLIFEPTIVTHTAVAGRMAPNTATGLLLTGLALVLLNTAAGGGRVAALLGAIATTLGLTALVGYATGLEEAYGWREVTRMALHTAATLTVLGIGILACTWERARARGATFFDWIVVPTAVTFVATTGLLWFALRTRIHAQAETTARAFSQLVDTQVGEDLETRLRTLDRMAARWDMRGGTPHREWKADARNLLRDPRGYAALAWIDRDGRDRWMVDAATPARPWRRLLKRASARLRTTDTPRISVEPLSDGRSTALAFVVVTHRPRPGVIVALADSASLFGAALARVAPRFSVEIASADRTLFVRDVGPRPTDALLVQTADLAVPGGVLHVGVWPGTEALGLLLTRLPEMVLGLGVLLTLLLVTLLEHHDRSARTARMLAATHERIRESDERFHLAVEGAQDGIWDWDLRTGAVFFSERMLDLVGGYEAEEGHGRIETFLGRLHPDDRDEVQARIDAHLTRRVPYAADYRLRMLNGEYRWFHERGQAIWDDAGNAIRMAGSVSDITERKAKEEELSRAKDDALVAVRAKAEFLATMSHEIRTPMTAVIGMTDILLETSLSAEQREFAEVVRRSAGALLTLINDILDFSKIEAGRMNVESVDFDPGATIEEAVALLAEQAQAKHLELVCALSPALPASAAGDPGRLRQILVNLVGNAVKFTDRGEIVVRASVVEETSSACVLRCEIEDTGVGIAPEVQGQLFQAFVQGDASTTRRFGGTGLGLAICKRLTESMGGTIDVESTPGVGSTFGFTMRLGTRPDASAPHHPDVPELRGVRALVIDDSAAGRTAVRQHLEAWGIVVDEAADGARGVETLARAHAAGLPHQLLVLDAELPAPTGSGSVSRIAEDARFAGLPTVALTTRSGRRSVRETAGTTVLVKPLRRAALLDAILAVLARTSPEAPSPHALAEESTGGLPAARRVLVVDDHPASRRVTLLQLQHLGCQADGVASGRDALDALARTSYDLVLMDCRMPGMDGFEATVRLRAREGDNRHTLVVALTADALEGDRERCLSAGMDDYLAKPVTIAALRGVLTRLGNHEETARPVAAAIPSTPTSEGPVDLASLARYQRSGEPDVLKRLIDLFLETTRRDCTALRAAILTGDARALERAAHSLKGGSASLGARDLAALGLKLQELGQAGSTEGALAILEGVEREVERVGAALAPFRG